MKDRKLSSYHLLSSSQDQNNIGNSFLSSDFEARTRWFSPLQYSAVDCGDGGERTE